MVTKDLINYPRVFMKLFSGKHAETVLEEALKVNPYFPFERVSDETTKSPVYICTVRYRRFYLSLVLAGLSGLFTIVWPTLGGNVQYCMFSVLILTISGFYSVEYLPLRTIVHDPSSKYFTVYRGRKVIACNSITDLFIRMISKHIGSKGPRYHLILDGNGLELPVFISGETTNRKKLRHLAHNIANQLDINYFDINNISRHHLIKQDGT